MKNDYQKLKVKNDGLKRDQSRGRKSDDEKEYIAIIVSDGEIFITCDESFLNITRQDVT
jgi:hypothetical protein